MSSASPVICALLPAFNEAERIGNTIRSLRTVGRAITIVVVDDGSDDETASRARESGADIVISQKNGGKGSALTAAYHQVRDKADILLLLDSDLESSASECEKLLVPLLTDEADMTIALLPPDPNFSASGRKGGMGWVVRLARWGIARRAGRVFQQPLSGQRAVRKTVLESVGGRFARGFGVEVDLTVRVLTHGFRVSEIEANFRHHVTSTDWTGIRHRARQLLDVARVLLLSR